MSVEAASELVLVQVGGAVLEVPAGQGHLLGRRLPLGHLEQAALAADGITGDGFGAGESLYRLVGQSGAHGAVLFLAAGAAGSQAALVVGPEVAGRALQEEEAAAEPGLQLVHQGPAEVGGVVGERAHDGAVAGEVDRAAQDPAAVVLGGDDDELVVLGPLHPQEAGGVERALGAHLLAVALAPVHRPPVPGPPRRLGVADAQASGLE